MKLKNIVAISMASVTALSTMSSVANALDNKDEKLTHLSTRGIRIPKFPGEEALKEGKTGDYYLNPERGKWFKFDGKYFLRYQDGDNWYDTNKWYMHDDTFRPRGGHDKLSCWAAAASNQFQWWLHENKKYVDRYFEVYPDARDSLLDNYKITDKYREDIYSPILDFMRYYFKDHSGFPVGGNHFLIAGEKLGVLGAPFNDDVYDEKTGGVDFKGFFSKVFNKKYAGKEYNLTKYLVWPKKQEFSDFLKNAFESGKSVAFSGLFSEKYQHAVTMWAADFDENGVVKYIYYTDSDEFNRETEKVSLMKRMRIVYSDDGKKVAMTSYPNKGYGEVGVIPITTISTLDLGTDIWEKWYKEHTPESSEISETSTPVKATPEVNLKEQKVLAYDKDIKEDLFNVESNVIKNSEIKSIKVLKNVDGTQLGEQQVKLEVTFTDGGSKVVSYTVDVHKKTDTTINENNAKKLSSATEEKEIKTSSTTETEENASHSTSVVESRGNELNSAPRTEKTTIANVEEKKDKPATTPNTEEKNEDTSMTSVKEGKNGDVPATSTVETENIAPSMIENAAERVDNVNVKQSAPVTEINDNAKSTGNTKSAEASKNTTPWSIIKNIAKSTKRSVVRSFSGGGYSGGSSSSSTASADNNDIVKKNDELKIENATRLAGKDRVETSIETSKLSNSDTVVIVSADKYSDALSGQNLVNKYGYKLVLVNENTDLSRIIDSSIKHVYIIGGEKSVSKGLEERAKGLNKSVVRISGKSRYETNKMTLEKAKYDKVAVVNGTSFTDSLSVEGLLVKENIGLNLVDGMGKYKTDKEVVYTIGGKNSIKETRGTRIAGKDRYETNKLINERIGNVDTVSIVSGKNFADGLSASNIVKNKGGSVVIVNHSVDNKTRDYIMNKKIYIVGGTHSVSDNLLK